MSAVHERSIVAEARALRDRCARGGENVVSAAPAPTAGKSTEVRAQRRELYALLGVCAEQVVGDFIAIVPPGEQTPVAWLSPGISPSAIFTDLLQETMHRFFAEHGNRWRDGGQTTQIGALLARIDQLGPQASRVLDRRSFHYAEHLLHTGMRTITPIAPGVMAAIIELAHRAGMSTAPHEIAKIARRSVRVPSQLAALSLGRFGEVQNRLIDTETMELDLSAVRLGTGHRGERLEIDLPSLALDRTSPPESHGPPASDHTLGCPALLPLGPASALDRLWTWTVELADECGYLEARARCVR